MVKTSPAPLGATSTLVIITEVSIAVSILGRSLTLNVLRFLGPLSIVLISSTIFNFYLKCRIEETPLYLPCSIILLFTFFLIQHWLGYIHLYFPRSYIQWPFNTRLLFNDLCNTFLQLVHIFFLVVSLLSEWSWSSIGAIWCGDPFLFNGCLVHSCKGHLYECK